MFASDGTKPAASRADACVLGVSDTVTRTVARRDANLPERTVAPGLATAWHRAIGRRLPWNVPPVIECSGSGLGYRCC